MALKNLSQSTSGSFETLESRVLFSVSAESIVPHPVHVPAPVATSSATAGRGITSEYFAGSNFQTPVAINPDVRINFKWNHGRPVKALTSALFSAKWTGQIAPASTDTYTFLTNADSGTRVIINGVTVIDNLSARSASVVSGSIALTGGVKVSIEVDYVSRGTGVPRIQLLWSSSSFSKQIVPEAVLFPADVALPVEPLTGYYFSGENFKALKQVEADASINYKLDPNVPDSRFPMNSTFSVRWIGYFTAPVSGRYAFRTLTDDGTRLFVNGNEIINQWHDEALTSHYGSIMLTAGQTYPLRMDYYENGAQQAQATLLWKVPGATAYGYVPFVSPLPPAGDAGKCDRSVGVSLANRPRLE